MIEVNALGQACPIPVVRTRKALAQPEGAAGVCTLVDNEIAVQNLSKMANQLGYAVQSAQRGPGVYAVTIQPAPGPAAGGPAPGPAPAPAEQQCIPCRPAGAGTVVLVGAATMGSGSDELGAALAKSFLYALANQQPLPATVIFFNGGAHLTCEGSPALEDLRQMQQDGVEILTCGTCLDYYGLKQKLAVGGVSNMYTIVEKAMQAQKVVRI